MDFIKLKLAINEYGSLSEAFERIETGEINFLKAIVDSWTKELEIAHNILNDYASMKVSDDDVKTVLKNNLDSAYEVYTNGIGDSCVRSVFINQVLSHFELNAFPCYGDSEEYKEKWQIAFDNAIIEKKFQLIK